MIKFNNYYLLFIFFICSIIGLKFNHVFFYCSILLIIIYSVKCKNNDFIYITFFLIPNIRIYDILGFKNYINIIFLILAFFYLKKNNCFYFKKKRILALMTFIVIIEAIHLVLYNSTFLLISELCTLFPFLINLYIFCMFLYENKKFSLHKISLHLILGVLNSSILKIVEEPSATLSFYTATTSRFFAFSGDPNYFSLYLLIGISYLLFYYPNRLLKMLIFPLVFLGLLSSSKMFILCLFFLIGMYFFNNYKKKRFYLKTIPLIVFLTFLIFLLYGDVVYSLIEKVIIRFGFSQTEIKLSDITSDRSDIILTYLRILVKNPYILLFGGGLRYNYLFSLLVAHNTYLDIILSFGMLGFFYICLSIFYFKRLFKGKYSFINYQYLFIFGIVLNSLSTLTADMFFYLLFLTILPLIQGDEING